MQPSAMVRVIRVMSTWHKLMAHQTRFKSVDPPEGPNELSAAHTQGCVAIDFSLLTGAYHGFCMAVMDGWCLLPWMGVSPALEVYFG